MPELSTRSGYPGELDNGVDNNDTSVPGPGSGIIGINPDSAQEFWAITNSLRSGIVLDLSE